VFINIILKLLKKNILYSINMSSKITKTASEFSQKTKKGVESWVNHLFQDACQKNWKGQVVRGPGLWCGMWVALVVLGTVANIVLSWRITDEVSRTQIVVQNVIDIVLSMVVIYFIIRMCQICRGWSALFVVIVFNIVFAALRLKFFSSYSLAMQNHAMKAASGK
jgi:hypothetical protein